MNEFIFKEAFNTFAGRRLGGGVAREVYECAIDPTLVVKIENAARSFQNVSEWESWEIVREHGWARDFFAPCVAISPCGSVLVQKRTTRPRVYPEWAPAIWTDLKLSNFGIFEGRLVCHDYGLSLIADVGLRDEKPRLRRARWWDESDSNFAARESARHSKSASLEVSHD